MGEIRENEEQRDMVAWEKSKVKETKFQKCRSGGEQISLRLRSRCEARTTLDRTFKHS